MVLGTGETFGFVKAFLKGQLEKVSTAIAEAKAQHLKSARRVQGSKASQQRARVKAERRCILAELQHTKDYPIHPLWAHLPTERRSWRARQSLRMRRLWAWLKQKRQRIALVVIVYLLIWSIPLLAGEPLLSAFAFLPLVLVPPVGYLVYWLVWKEFHA